MISKVAAVFFFALFAGVQANHHCDVVTLSLDTDFPETCQCAVYGLLQAINGEMAHKVCGEGTRRSLRPSTQRRLNCNLWCPDHYLCYIHCGGGRRLQESNDQCGGGFEADDADMKQLQETLEDNNFVQIKLDQTYIDGYARALHIAGDNDGYDCVDGISASTLAVMLSALE